MKSSRPVWGLGFAFLLSVPVLAQAAPKFCMPEGRGPVAFVLKAIRGAFSPRIDVLPYNKPSVGALAELLGLKNTDLVKSNEGGGHVVCSSVTAKGRESPKLGKSPLLPLELHGQPADRFVYKIAKPRGFRAFNDAFNVRNEKTYRLLENRLADTGIRLPRTFFFKDSVGNLIEVSEKLEGTDFSKVTRRAFEGAFTETPSDGHIEDLIRDLINGDPVDKTGADPEKVARILEKYPSYRKMISQWRMLKELNDSREAWEIQKELEAVGDPAQMPLGYQSRPAWLDGKALVRIDARLANVPVVIGEDGQPTLAIWDY